MSNKEMLHRNDGMAYAYKIAKEQGLDVVSNCKDCFRYKGCEDCALFETEYCDGKGE